jgi:hypothetical protein
MGQNDQLFCIRFISSNDDSKIYNLGVVLLDLKSGRLFNLEVLSSSQNSILQKSLELPPKAISSKIQKTIYEGQHLKVITKTLNDQFKSSLSSEGFREEILHYCETNDKVKVAYLLGNIISKAAGVSNHQIEISLDTITIGEYEDTNSSEELDSIDPNAKNNNPDLTNAATDIPPGSRLVQCKLQLSPVSGIPVSSLTFGSKIVVRLNPSDPTTNETIQTMNLKEEDGSIKPIQAQIHKIAHNGSESEIIIKISENIYSKLLEEVNTVKVKTSMAESRSTAKKNINDIEKNIEALKTDSSLFFYAIGIAALIAFGILLVVFFI